MELNFHFQVVNMVNMVHIATFLAQIFAMIICVFHQTVHVLTDATMDSMATNVTKASTVHLSI